MQKKEIIKAFEKGEYPCLLRLTCQFEDDFFPI